jgi:hypothetical protein
LFGDAFLCLSGPFLGGAFFFLAGALLCCGPFALLLCGALSLLPGLFLLSAFLGGAFFFLAGAILFLAGGSLLFGGALALGDARRPGGALMLRTALLLLPSGAPLLVGQVWLYCAVRRCSASRLWADVVDFWTRNAP